MIFILCGIKDGAIAFDNFKCKPTKIIPISKIWIITNYLWNKVECTISDGSNAIGNSDRTQFGAPAECIRPNGSNTIRNIDRS